MASGPLRATTGTRITLTSATEGISVYGHLVYDRGSNTVRIFLAARNMSGTFGTGTPISVIPEGYRPKQEYELPAFVGFSDTSFGIYAGSVYPSGAIAQRLTSTAKSVIIVGEYPL